MFRRQALQQVFCRVTGLTSHFLSFIVQLKDDGLRERTIRFFHGALQLDQIRPVYSCGCCVLQATYVIMTRKRDFSLLTEWRNSLNTKDFRLAVCFMFLCISCDLSVVILQWSCVVWLIVWPTQCDSIPCKWWLYVNIFRILKVFIPCSYFHSKLLIV